MIEYSDKNFSQFQNKRNGFISFGHLSINKLLNLGIIDKEYFDKSFKFAFVRNSYDRLFSTYNYLKKIGLNNNASLFNKKVSEYKSFKEFVYREFLDKEFHQIGLYKAKNNSLLSPQNIWVTDKKKLITNFIGYYENLNKDWERVCNICGINFKKLKKTNVLNPNIDYRKMHTPDLVDIVSNEYQSDIEMFNYKFE